MKLAVQTRFEAKPTRFAKAVEQGVYRNMFHMAASVRKATAARIEKAPQGQASDPGESPHTHKGIQLRRALRFDVSKEKQDAVMGFRYSMVGDVGALHEFGERRDGVKYPKRPTLGPTLEGVALRLGGVWQGSIGA